MNWKFHKQRKSPSRRYRSEDMDGNDDDGIRIVAAPQISGDSSLQGNKIYFYVDVTRESILTLIRQIDDSKRHVKMVQYTYSLSEPPPIELHISSDGGDLIAALGAIDKISKSDVPIHTYCEGGVASAATIMSIVGHKRFITQNSFMMIHQLSSENEGTYVQIKEDSSNLDLFMKKLKLVYCNYSKLTSEQLDGLLTHDLYWEADQCLEVGLVDQII